MQHVSAESPQQFCLRWNNYQSNLTNVFDQLLQSESFVDVTLACDGHSVKAHKMVLSACSPYFQALFFDNPCQHPIVILKDIKWPELKAVVEFMYKGEINVSQEQIGPLLKVAESLKIRGLADVNGEPEFGGDAKKWSAASSQGAAVAAHDLSPDSAASPAHRHKKRRRVSGERASPEEGDAAPGGGEPPPVPPAAPTCLDMSLAANQPAPPPPPPPPHGLALGDSLPPPPPPPAPAHPDDMEIKPGIAEMIREEERAKLLESSHAWLGASTSSIADSYQYQLQSMWQKCWNTNQSLVHNLRFRERGPLKSWRPETMAEAIFSVLKEGLSLSQAARKYDIPYPTFVLYANRVHNMLGPSVDGSADLRPKGRGRPQRILLGSWPEDHIHGVIRAVVFRDPQHIKEEPHLSYPRLPVNAAPYHSRNTLEQLGVQGYGQAPCSNGPEPTVSPGAAAAAAVAAVAQGLRQQMCNMVAAAQHQQGLAEAGLAGLVAGHCGLPPANGTAHGGLPPSLSLPSPASPAESAAVSPAPSPAAIDFGLAMAYKPPPSTFASPRPDLFHEELEELVSAHHDGLVRSPLKAEPIAESGHAD
ncbi:protein bric-a-brac 1-like isoform X2 [Bacillus rossius redtenbacheri]|uniref:protein bric-a-brac 1-like isoform X2 n=1 Tax=Bacillus rossius redtenbacheri TaxID=93214 RepID=UPI002FDDAB5C